jgi:hypothetical protein
MSEANEDQGHETIQAVEPSITPERVLELAGGNGGASPEEQQAMAVALLKYQLVVGESASRVGAYAFSASAIMQSTMGSNAHWTKDQHELFRFLVERIAKEQDKTEEPFRNLQIAQMLQGLVPILSSLTHQTPPEAKRAVSDDRPRA